MFADHDALHSVRQCTLHTLPCGDGILVYLSSHLGNLSLGDLHASKAAEEQNPPLAPRGWWKAETDRNLKHGLGDFLAALRDILANDHYGYVPPEEPL